jgi:hypothetical protein
LTADRMDAIQTLLTTARDKRWCVKPYCATCGAREYRQAIHDNAVALVDALKSARLDELRRQFREIHVDDALRLMLMELADPFGPLLGVTRTADVELGGTEAGEYLTRMRRHEERLVEERARRAEYASPAAAAERRRLKKEARLARSAERTSQKAVRDAEIGGAVAAFAKTSPTDAVERISRDEAGFPLYRLPEAQVTTLVTALASLSDENLVRLRKVVPVTRAMPLALLSRGIDGEVRARADMKKDGSPRE